MRGYGQGTLDVEGELTSMGLPELADAMEALLTTVRSRTLEISTSHEDALMTRQFNELMGPIAWDLRHCAEFEDLWLNKIDLRTVKCVDDRGLLPHYFDAFEVPRRERHTVPQHLLTMSVVRSRLESVREEAITRLRGINLGVPSPLVRGGYIWNITAQHEVWHQETMLVAMNTIPIEQWGTTSRPVGARTGVAESRIAGDWDAEMVPIEEGEFMMGSASSHDVYDNERPQHMLRTNKFWIDRFPVSNRRYIKFLDSTSTPPPFGWYKASGRWHRTWFGKSEPVALAEPVCGVSHDEAVKFAAFEGKRLPSEAEWEKAATWDTERRVKRRFPWGDDPPTAEHVNANGVVGGRPTTLGTLPRGRSAYGCEHMLGDCWEWVNNKLYEYPGFQPWHYYSFTVPFIGTDFVLRGGSWATGWPLIRGTLRNWDLPHRKQIFAGLRCVRDN